MIVHEILTLAKRKLSRRVRKQLARDFARSPRTRRGNELVAGHRRSGLDMYSRALPEACVLIDAVADMQNELRRRSCNSFAMRNVVERPLQFRMLVDVLANLGHRLAGRS